MTYALVQLIHIELVVLEVFFIIVNSCLKTYQAHFQVYILVLGLYWYIAV